MNRSLGLVLFAGAAIVAGALLLKGFAGEGPNNPVASVLNGHPRGTMALLRLLESYDVEVQVRTAHSDPIPDGLLIVPPPERASWNEPEVQALRERVAGGELDILVFCDDTRPRNRRLAEFQKLVGARCDHDVNAATATLVDASATLEPTGAGGLEVSKGEPATPLARAGDRDVWVTRAIDQGQVMLVASSSLITNDGLGQGDNAAWMVGLAQGRPVVLDEAHHHVRRAEVLAAAFGRAGPQAGLLALLLLIPLSLLGLGPRPGDPPGPAEAERPPAAEGAARALAALYQQAGLKEPEAFSALRSGAPPTTSPTTSPVTSPTTSPTTSHQR